MARKFRPAKPADFIQIDSIRFEHGSTAPRQPDVKYVVAERDGRVTAFFGLRHDGPTRALVVDFYGRNAHDWKALQEKLMADSDKRGVELSAWCSINNKNVRYFEKDGFKPVMYLVRRQPKDGAE
jgi:hypothetical protein